MKRGGPPKRKKGMKRTGRLRPRSEKTQKRYEEERIPFVREMLERYPVCYVCERPELDVPVKGTWWADDVNEIRPRGRTGGVHGDDWLKEENIHTLCRIHHTWVTDNPGPAALRGLVE